MLKSLKNESVKSDCFEKFCDCRKFAVRFEIINLTNGRSFYERNV